ncbi:MAG: flavodoxin family protein [Candidatus Methylophosphatis roskildensis]
MTESTSPSDCPGISIVFHSGNGHTTEMSRAVARGASAAGNVSVVEHQISDADFKGGRWQNDDVLSRLDASDAIIFGSPTYMGGVSAQLKSFMDSTSSRYLQRKRVDKIAAAFTVSGLPSGDKHNMLLTCATFAMQHGMIWVGVAESPVTGDGYNRLGFFFGAAGQALFEPPSEAPSAEDKRTGEMLGRRVATLTRRLYDNRRM